MLAALLVSLAIAEASKAAAASDFGSDGDRCQAGDACKLTGKITLVSGVPYSVAILEMVDGRRLPIALSREMMGSAKVWNGRRVTVTGIGMTRPPQGDTTIGVLYADRWIATGVRVTGDVAVYALTLKRE